MEVLHGADHAGEVLLYGGDQQGPVIEDLPELKVLLQTLTMFKLNYCETLEVMVTEEAGKLVRGPRRDHLIT